MNSKYISNGQSIVLNGVVVARTLVSASADTEITTSDAEKLAKTICESLNGKEVFKQSSTTLSKPKPTKRKTTASKKF